MIDVLGFAAHSPTTPLEPFRFERRSPRSDDIVIDILYCGVCHSDIHNAHNDWGGARYPVVPGHEIIGRVREVGDQVTRLKVGDHVGVGCMVDSCQSCKPCHNDLEQYCEKGATLAYKDVDQHDGMITYGGYSQTIVTREKFVLKIPENLDLKGSAPLLCAGITTYSPLKHWKVGKGMNVAVVGMGGLGHMALKLAKAMGATVTLLTRSPGKEEDARRLGADHVVLSTQSDQMDQVKGTFDLIIDTVPYQHDLAPYVTTLSLSGTLVLVGYLGPLEPALNTVPLILGRKAVAGSVIGGIKETQEMLDFCAQHQIVSDIELISMQDINVAYQRMLKSDVKYRFVIDLASLES